MSAFPIVMVIPPPCEAKVETPKALPLRGAAGPKASVEAAKRAKATEVAIFILNMNFGSAFRVVDDARSSDSRWMMCCVVRK